MSLHTTYKFLHFVLHLTEFQGTFPSKHLHPSEGQYVFSLAYGRTVYVFFSNTFSFVKCSFPFSYIVQTLTAGIMSVLPIGTQQWSTVSNITVYKAYSINFIAIICWGISYCCHTSCFVYALLPLVNRSLKSTLKTLWFIIFISR